MRGFNRILSRIKIDLQLQANYWILDFSLFNSLRLTHFWITSSVGTAGMLCNIINLLPSRGMIRTLHSSMYHYDDVSDNESYWCNLQQPNVWGVPHYHKLWYSECWSLWSCPGTLTTPIAHLVLKVVLQVHNGMCVLTQNIVNEKIYLVLWFWYLFLGPVSVLYLCYRLITLMFHGVRYSLLYRKVRRKYDVDIQRSLEFVLAKGQIGDWFVLYQLSKNCNPYFYREFIKELAKDMREKPKKSKSNAGSSTGNI